MQESSVTADGRRLRGDASRRSVLAVAVDLASVEGLDQVSIGRIASVSLTSKSSVATLFGTKERLQLAAVAAARERFLDHVVDPARVQPRGIRRLVALLDRSVAYSQDRVFPGGCFFSAAAADFHSKPGKVRDAIAAQLADWVGYLAVSARYAHEQGELPALDDPDQLAFELQGLFEWMNLLATIRDTDEPYVRARRAYRDRLLAAGADPAIADLVLEPGAALRP
ncbi:TetR/AcrR family transcriptional regulator [Agromyces intestinalis]|uniref:TetR/AcrR family transcriptional regulator n=1 Tax=Agromyces intestinalis TaxID=2592652 RepID=A0A5C1YEX3_9MICO|nr:TetR/AcrR family transcriptional regulator [Agromyces intestinalis]QEO14613.1 TetR/AcrR family transcriptional regulator [Agromyces intestinalis]